MSFTNWAPQEPSQKQSEIGENYMVAVQPDMKFEDKIAEHKANVICQTESDNGKST